MPLILGGRHPLGRFTYLALVSLLSLCWVLQSNGNEKVSWRPTRVGWLLVAGAVLCIIQMLPLPEQTIQLVSPYQSKLLAHWSPEVAAALPLQPWRQISLTPHATWLGLGMFVAHAMLFCVLVQRFQDLDRIRQWLHWIAIAGLGMALLGLLQYASRTERFTWLFEHYSRPANIDVTGPFVNSNHYAHFLALTIGPLVWWLLELNQPTKAGPTGNKFGGQQSRNSLFPIAAGAALAVVGIAGLMAHSRGGILVMFAGLFVAISLCVWRGVLTSRAWYVMGGVALLMLVGLGIHGYEEVRREVQSMTSVESIDHLAARRNIWQANLETAKHFLVFGTGIGSHGQVYEHFFPHFSLVHFSHAESSILQVLSETGVMGAGLLLVGIGYLAAWIVPAIRASATNVATYSIAVAAGLVVSLTHAVFDFPWHIPSCMALAIMFAAAACALCEHAQPASNPSSPTPRRNPSTDFATIPRWGMVIGLALLLFCTQFHFGPAMAGNEWFRYRKASLQSRSMLHTQLTTSKDQQERREKLSQSMYLSGRRMAQILERVIQHDPNHLKAHSRLATTCVQLFNHLQLNSENAMDLSQIRDAAVASKFDSRESLDQWLQAAVGDRRWLLDKARYHALRALDICPLEGRDYLNLAELGFLDGLTESGSSELVQAAVRVKPYDGAVLFAVGRQAALTGDTESALTSWRKSFQFSREYRLAIMNALAPIIPPEFFVNQFEPDAEGLQQLFSLYRSRDMRDQARTVAPLVLQHLAESAEEHSGIRAANDWHRSRDVCRYTGDLDGALRCAQKAVEVAPNWYNGRIALAEEWMARENYEPAIREYTWCSRRRPFDKRVSGRLATIESLRFQKRTPTDAAIDATLVPYSTANKPHEPQLY